MWAYNTAAVVYNTAAVPFSFIHKQVYHIIIQVLSFSVWVSSKFNINYFVEFVHFLAYVLLKLEEEIWIVKISIN